MSPKPLPTFKLGDHVKWTSQANGKPKLKYGCIVEVVPAGSLAKIRMTGWSVLPRGHESYVIDTGSHLYWPRVVHLRLNYAADKTVKQYVEEHLLAEPSRETRLRQAVIDVAKAVAWKLGFGSMEGMAEEMAKRHLEENGLGDGTAHE